MVEDGPDGVGEVDEQAVTPDAAALEAVHAAILDYNGTRPAVERDMLIRIVLMVGGYILAVAFVFYVTVQQNLSNATGWVFALGFIGGFWVWQFALQPSKNFQQYLRDRMLPLIFGFVGNVRYRAGHAPPFMARMPVKELVGRSNAIHNDYISGTFDGLDFTLSETELSTGSGKHKSVLFRGVIFHFQRETPFPGQLFAAKRPHAVARFLRDLFGTGSLDRVTSGYAPVDDSHEFMTSNRSAATPVVQGTLAKALDYLSGVWTDDVVRIALVGQDCYLLVPSKRDLFELPTILSDIEFHRHVKPMIRDLVTLLATARLVSRIE